MRISSSFELPKQFYEIQVIYSSKENLKDFILELEKLDTRTITDLANFSYVIGENEVTERAIFFLSISSLKELKLLFNKSELIKGLNIKDITQQLLTGKYNNQYFWTILESKEYNSEDFKKDDVDFFLEFIKQNSSADFILDKINHRGLNNLLEPELQILDSNS
mgnify:CR=1 FL=1